MPQLVESQGWDLSGKILVPWHVLGAPHRRAAQKLDRLFGLPKFWRSRGAAFFLLMLSGVVLSGQACVRRL